VTCFGGKGWCWRGSARKTRAKWASYDVWKIGRPNVKCGNEEDGHRDWYYMYLLNKWWWKCNADKVPWFRAVSTSGRRPIYRQRETVLECLVLGQGRL
jgi:hypothetical protein